MSNERKKCVQNLKEMLLIPHKIHSEPLIVETSRYSFDVSPGLQQTIERKLKAKSSMERNTEDESFLKWEQKCKKSQTDSETAGLFSRVAQNGTSFDTSVIDISSDEEQEDDKESSEKNSIPSFNDTLEEVDYFLKKAVEMQPKFANTLHLTPTTNPLKEIKTPENSSRQKFDHSHCDLQTCSIFRHLKRRHFFK